MMVMTDIHVRSFTGSHLKSYLHPIAKLRMEVFKEYPYFEEPDLNHEIKYLEKIFSCKETIGVLIFDNTTLIGVSLGCPLTLEEAAIQNPILERHTTVDSYYFFGNSTLLKNYRSRGIGHHFYDAREMHVTQYKKFKHICFCVPDCSGLDANRPKDYVPLIDFWRKRGYIHHPEIKCTLSWKKLNETQTSNIPMSFWIKELPTYAISKDSRKEFSCSSLA